MSPDDFPHIVLFVCPTPNSDYVHVIQTGEDMFTNSILFWNNVLVLYIAHRDSVRFHEN